MNDVNGDIKKIKTELKYIKWLIGYIATIVTAIIVRLIIIK
ncbi:MAG: hypothetical protein QW734_03865 [Candidatus Bathyarchaeia archaeon]